MTTYVPYDEQAPASGAKFIPYDGPAISPVPQQATPAKRTFTEELLHQLGRGGRMLATGATGVGGALADFGYGAANAVGNLVNGKPVIQGPPPSQQFQQKLTQLGLPEDVTPEEKATGFLGSMVAGGLDPANNAITRGVSSLFSTPQNFVSEIDNVRNIAQQLRQQGYKLPPSLAKDNIAARTLEGFGGKTQIERSMQEANQPVTQNLVRGETGIPQTTPVTLDVLKNRAAQIAEQGYRPVENLPVPMGVGNRYRTALMDIRDSFGTNNSFPLAQRNVVRDEVNKYLYQPNGRPIQSFTGKDAIKAIQNLRQEANDLYTSEGGDKALAATKSAIAKALEDQIELNLNGLAKGAPSGMNIPPNLGSQILENFRNARVDLAKNYATRRMLADPFTGEISTAKATNVTRSGTPLTGGLDTVANAGSPAFNRATTVPTRGDVPELNPWDYGLMGAGGAGVAYGHAGYGAVGVGLPIARLGARKAIESDWMQKMLGGSSMLTPEAKRAMLLQGTIQAAPYSSIFNPYSTQ